MKNYPHIIAKVYGEPWLIRKDKHLAIQRLLESRMDSSADTIIEVKQDEETPEDEMHRDGETAIIPVRGIIGKHLSSLETMCGGCDLDDIGAQLDMAANDSSIKRILMTFDSPGGTVTGVPEMARKISSIGKETIAFTDSQCCSAAYWMGSQCKRFFSTGSADVGSIGVYMAMLDRSRALENEGIKVNAISAGKYKLAGAPFRPLTDEERAMFQADVDKIHANFKAAVVQNRDVPEECMEGQCFMGDEAQVRGLVDAVVEDIFEVLEN